MKITQILRASVLLSFILLCQSFSSWAQDDNALFERPPFRLKIPIDRNRVFESDIPATPYIQTENIVIMYPGETVYLEVDKTEGTWQLHSVRTIRDSARTLVISFNQHAKKDKHQSMMLKIRNPFKSDLSYTATIFPMRVNQWVPTTVIPVKAGISSIEVWTDPIVSIGLGEWKFVTKE